MIAKLIKTGTIAYASMVKSTLAPKCVIEIFHVCVCGRCYDAFEQFREIIYLLQKSEGGRVLSYLKPDLYTVKHDYSV